MMPCFGGNVAGEVDSSKLFYVEGSIEAAVKNAVGSNLLSSEEALAEARILLHFAPKLSVLRDQGAPKIASFQERLLNQAQKVAPIVQKLPDPLPTLFHEYLHALLWRHKAKIEVAAKSVGLSFGALNGSHRDSPPLTNGARLRRNVDHVSASGSGEVA
jgi:hypothetical protein